MNIIIRLRAVTREPIAGSAAVGAEPVGYVLSGIPEELEVVALVYILVFSSGAHADIHGDIAGKAAALRFGNLRPLSQHLLLVAISQDISLVDGIALGVPAGDDADLVVGSGLLIDGRDELLQWPRLRRVTIGHHGRGGAGGLAALPRRQLLHGLHVHFET